MRVSAKTDYAVRAAIELAASPDGPVKGERIAQAQEIPLKFLENILGDLRHAGIVRSQRGVEGGYWLARPPSEITLADVIRAVDGPIANVRATIGGPSFKSRTPWRKASFHSITTLSRGWTEIARTTEAPSGTAGERSTAPAAATGCRIRPVAARRRAPRRRAPGRGSRSRKRGGAGRSERRAASPSRRTR